MESRLGGTPTGPATGIRAPLTVDDFDFEYSVSSESQKNNATSRHFSGYEFDSDGLVSGDDEYEAASEEHIFCDQDEEILEETHFARAFAFSRPVVKSPHGEIVRRSSNSREHGFSLSPVKSPDEVFASHSGGVGGNAFFRPLVRVPDEKIRKGIKNVNESDDEPVEDDDSVSDSSVYRPTVAAVYEEPSESELIVDAEMLLMRRMYMPIAPVSMESDDDSQGSEALDDSSFSAVRIPSIEVLQRFNSAPKVRFSDVDERDDYESLYKDVAEMDFVENSVISDGVLGSKNGKEHIHVDDATQRDLAFPDKGPDAGMEAGANSSVAKEDYCVSQLPPEQSGDLMHLDEDIREVNVIDDWGDHIAPGPFSPVASAVKEEFPCEKALVIEPEVIDLNKSGDFGALSVDDGDPESINTIIDDSLVDNQDTKTEKLDGESGLKIEPGVEFSDSAAARNTESVYQSVDIQVMPTEGCPQFSGLEELVLESEQVDIPTSLLNNAHQSDRLGTELDSEDKEVAGYSKQLPLEAKNSTFRSDDTCAVVADVEREKESTLSGGEFLQDHLQETDVQDSTDSDKRVDADCGFRDRKHVIGSISLPAFLKAVRGALSDGGAVERNLNPFAPLTTYGQLDGALSQGEKKKLEKIQHLRVQYVLLLQRLGRSPQDSVAANVLCQLKVAEARWSSVAFNVEPDKGAAMQLKARTKNHLDLSLSILVIGKTGVGKSATIDSIVGEKMTTVDAFEPATSDVKEIIGKIDGMPVKIFDTPGLRISPTDQPINRRILTLIKKVMRNCPPDVILYVDRLDAQNNYLNDLPVLKLVTSYLGSSIWHKAVCALTNANSVPPDGPDGCPLSYEVFVAERSRVVRQLISHAAGEPLLMNPGSIILVENQAFAKKNGETWRSQLLFSSLSMKTLSELSSAVMVCHRSSNRKLFDCPEPSYQLLTRPVMDNHGQVCYCGYDDTAIEDNIDRFPAVVSVQLAKDRKECYIQFSVGRKTRLNIRAGLDRKLNGQISMKTSCSNQFQIAAVAFLPIAKAMFNIFARKCSEG